MRCRPADFRCTSPGQTARPSDFRRTGAWAAMRFDPLPRGPHAWLHNRELVALGRTLRPVNAKDAWPESGEALAACLAPVSCERATMQRQGIVRTLALRHTIFRAPMGAGSTAASMVVRRRREPHCEPGPGTAETVDKPMCGPSLLVPGSLRNRCGSPLSRLIIGHLWPARATPQPIAHDTAQPIHLARIEVEPLILPEDRCSAARTEHVAPVL